MEATTIRIRKFSEPTVIVEFILETQEVERQTTQTSPRILDLEIDGRSVYAKIDKLVMWKEGDMVCFKTRDDQDAKTYKYDYRDYRDVENKVFINADSIVLYVKYSNSGYEKGTPKLIPGVRYFL